jgi:hypothetical protein
LTDGFERSGLCIQRIAMPGFNQFRHATALLIRISLLKTKVGATKKISGLHPKHYTDI